MSWVLAAPSVRGAGVDGDVFDENADESLVVRREWQSNMQRRVKVRRPDTGLSLLLGGGVEDPAHAWWGRAG